jgi:hypothetical protein
MRRRRSPRFFPVSRSGRGSEDLAPSFVFVIFRGPLLPSPLARELF